MNRRTPTMLQLAATECGHACVRMVLATHGRRVTMGALRREVPVGRDGTSLRGLADLVVAFGGRAEVRYIPLGEVARLVRPAILFWNRSHFVVLVDVRPGHLVVIDPSVGRLVVSEEEFAERFSGACLEVTGVERRSGGVSDAGWAARIRATVAGDRSLLSAALLVALGGAAVGALPLAAVLLLNGEAIAYLLLGGVIVLVLSAHAAAAFAGTAVNATAGPRLFQRLLRLPLAYFDARSPAELATRISAADTARDALVADGAVAVGAVATLLASTVSLGVAAPHAFAVALPAAAAAAALVLAAARAASVPAAGEAAALRSALGTGARAVQAIVAIKSQGLESREADTWAGAYTEALRHRRIVRAVGAASDALRLALVLAAPVIAAAVVASAGGAGAVVVGAVVGTTVCVSGAAALAERAVRLRALAHNVHDAADIMEELTDDEQREVEALGDGAMRVEGLSFRHTGARQTSLEGIDLEFPEGSSVAIVGASGSGKSTLAQLLVGLRAPTRGRVTVGGVDVCLARREAIAAHVGYVPQDVVLVAGSIAQNITLERPGITEEDVKRAAEVAGILDEIGDMPMGLRTVVTPSGAGLSGGQRQRIAVARALAAAPPILVLDEATSGLDPVAEHRVLEAVAGVVPTRIVVTHRPDTALRADAVVVLEKGRVVEAGPPARLRTAGGPFARLLDDAVPVNVPEAVIA